MRNAFYAGTVLSLDDLDESCRAAIRDIATVTKDGVLLAEGIQGVRTFSPPVHTDHRGRVFEVFPGRNAFWDEDIVYCYAWTIRPNMVKGWGLHQEKVDRYTLINGEIITVLCDARADSPTHGQVQQVVLSEQGVRQVRIPTGVWHMNVNVCQVEAHLINHPTRPYQHDNPDRLVLPWNTDAIPYDLRTLFPVQANPCPPCGAP